MTIDQSVFNQIATTLARHFDSLYYVEIKTGNFLQFFPDRSYETVSFPNTGEDFFELARENARKFVHPADQEALIKMYNKESIPSIFGDGDSYSCICRGLLNGKLTHLRHILLKCADKTHVICCLEDIDEEIREKEETKRNLNSAVRMARLDELTGIKNRNAYTETAAVIDAQIAAGTQAPFGIVMCDVNGLKHINDTRGHSFGDEALQRASNMICNIFKHSPVFRIGGDEFAVIISDHDYSNCEDLFSALRAESYSNMVSNTGPTVASGLAIFDHETDKCVASVFERADKLMYENKREIKNNKPFIQKNKKIPLNTIITPERKRLLDGLFGALYTTAGEGYVFLNDMHYDYSRWSLSLVCDFGLDSTYMYKAGDIWAEHIHPDDLEAYKKAVDAAFDGTPEVHPIHYRARRPDGSYVVMSTRAFVLTDGDGQPEYFGGIMIPQS